MAGHYFILRARRKLRASSILRAFRKMQKSIKRNGTWQTSPSTGGIYLYYILGSEEFFFALHHCEIISFQIVNLGSTEKSLLGCHLHKPFYQLVDPVFG